MEKMVLRAEVQQALRTIKARDPSAIFAITELQREIEAGMSASLSAEDLAQLKPIMKGLWRHGVEPAAIGGLMWKFGAGRPPVSRERRTG